VQTVNGQKVVSCRYEAVFSVARMPLKDTQCHYIVYRFDRSCTSLYYHGTGLHCDQNTATSNWQKIANFSCDRCEERRIGDEELSVVNPPQKILFYGV